MAFIYRYQLKNVALRDNTVLKQYTQDIQSVLEGHFNKNLKDSIVEEKYFEFKLYVTVSRKMLQGMGRKLKSRLPIGIEKYGFVRMEQTLYVLIYSPKDNQEDDIHIEFIDSTLLDKPEQYIQRANDFFEKASNSGLLRERGSVDGVNGVIKNYYIDVLNAYIDKNYPSSIFHNDDDLSCFFVKGYHRRYDSEQFDREQLSDNVFLLEKCADVGYVENREQIGEHEDNKSDYLEINMSEEQNKQIEKIKNELGLVLFSTEKVNDLDKIGESIKDGKSSNYKFRVHNVGQAQATSLAINDESPFMYFDYGMPYGGNINTRPNEVNMPTNPGTTIILSHLHQDHWFRIADDFNAYKCNWFIPDQPRRVRLNHVLAEIIVYGGSVQIINNDIIFRQGRITCGGVSIINPSRPSGHVHETGLSLRLEAHDVQDNDVNILVAGDQMYDYIDIAQLNNLDLLVACHHGGKYCWSAKGCVPNARVAGISTIIYSYGQDNTHNHPSNTKDYTSAKWSQEHHTINGDYEIIIYL